VKYTRDDHSPGHFSQEGRKCLGMQKKQRENVRGRFPRGKCPIPKYTQLQNKLDRDKLTYGYKPTLV